MTFHRLINAAIFAFMVAALSLSYLLDEPEPYTAAQADAISAARAEIRKERGARDLCVELYGPQAAHLWDATGSLICITRRGEIVAASTEGN